MKKLLFSVFSALMLISFTGCIDIVEDITVNKNGSGSYRYFTDLSNLKESLGGFMGEAGDDPFASVAGPLDTLVMTLEEVGGLSKIKKIEDKDKLHFGVEFNFKDEKSLNKALLVLLNGKSSIMSGDNPDGFRYTENLIGISSKSFSRKATWEEPEKLKEATGAMDEGTGMGSVEMLKDVKLVSKIHFVKRKVKSVANDAYKITDGGKSVEGEFYLFDPSRNTTKSLESKITLK